jgi:hypothetical protein
MISSEKVKVALLGDTEEFLEKIPNLVIFTEAVEYEEHVDALFQRLLKTPELLSGLILCSKDFDVLAQLAAKVTGGSYQRSLFASLLTNQLLTSTVTKNRTELYRLTIAIDRAVEKSRITATDASSLRNSLIMKLLEQSNERFFQVFHPIKKSLLEQLESDVVRDICHYYPEAKQALFDKEFDLIFPLIIAELTDAKGELEFSSILRLLWDESEDMYLRHETYTPRIYNKYRELMIARMNLLKNDEYKEWISDHLECLTKHEPEEITPRKTNEETVSSEQSEMLAASMSTIFGDSASTPITANTEVPVVAPLIPPGLKVS